MASILQNLLASFARLIIRKYQPKIIGITGSVGKTSSRNAIFLVVAKQFNVRQTEKNYNNELGVPLTIIGSHAPGRNPLSWLSIFMKASSYLLLPREYPEVLVLEMGVDHPGDMDHLLSIVKLDIGVLTYVGEAHYEFFGSIEAVAEEKSKLIKAVSVDGAVVANFDNQIVKQSTEGLTSKIIGYGKDSEAQVRLLETKEKYELNVSTVLQVESANSVYELSVPVLGDGHVYSLLAAIAVAEELGIHKDLVVQGLSNYKPVPGRLNVFAGIKRSIIIDDSYNASPDSMAVALSMITKFTQENKMLVLGDMLELGENSEQAHRKLGAIVAQMTPQYLVTVGKMGAVIAEEAITKGYPEHKTFSYQNSTDCVQKVLGLIEENQVVLIKGSQGVRMEKVSKEIMAEPMRAKELLPRQYGKWLQK